jgi:AcrR family transcriptional regulator
MARAGLTAAAVADAAAALADEVGLDNVTLARLAGRLGVRPPSLYKHVEGLDDIRRSLALKGLTEVNQRMMRATVGRSREEALIALAKAYWDFAREHPGLYAASLRAAGPGEAALAAAGGEVVGTVLGVLRGYGLSGDDALHATRGLRAILQGFLSLDAAGAFGLALDVEESLVRLVRNFADGLEKQAAANLPPRSPGAASPPPSAVPHSPLRRGE